jgi:hypothetical protein
VPTLTWSKRQIPDWTGLSCDSLMSSMFIASKRFAFTRDLRSFAYRAGRSILDSLCAIADRVNVSNVSIAAGPVGHGTLS